MILGLVANDSNVQVGVKLRPPGHSDIMKHVNLPTFLVTWVRTRSKTVTRNASPRSALVARLIRTHTLRFILQLAAPQAARNFPWNMMSSGRYSIEERMSLSCWIYTGINVPTKLQPPQSHLDQVLFTSPSLTCGQMVSATIGVTQFLVASFVAFLIFSIFMA